MTATAPTAAAAVSTAGRGTRRSPIRRVIAVGDRGRSPRPSFLCSCSPAQPKYTTMPALLDQAGKPTELGSAPLVVLTAAGHESDAVWIAAQDRMAALSTNSSHREADATHAGLLDEASGAQQSGQTIDDVVRAARTGTTLSPN